MTTLIQCNYPHGNDNTILNLLAKKIAIQTGFPFLSDSFDHMLLALKGLPNVEIEINDVPVPYSPQFEQTLYALKDWLSLTYPEQQPQLFINRNTVQDDTPNNTLNDEQIFKQMLAEMQISSDLLPAAYIEKIHAIINQLPQDKIEKFSPYVVKHFVEKGNKLLPFQAIIFFQAATKICNTRFKLHPYWAITLSSILDTVIFIFEHRRQYEQALNLAQQARQSLTVHYNEHNIMLANQDLLIARIFGKLNKNSNALKKYIAACPKIERWYGRDNSKTISSYNAYAQLFTEIGLQHEKNQHFEFALDAYKKSLEIYINFHGEAHLQTAYVLEYIGTILYRQNQYALALDHFDKSAEIIKIALGPISFDLAKISQMQAQIYVAQDDLNNAALHLIFAQSIIKKINPRHPEMAKVCHQMGEIFNSMHEYEHAKKHLSRALSIRTENFGSEHPYTQQTQQEYNLSLEYSEALTTVSYETDDDSASTQACSLNYPQQGINHQWNNYIMAHATESDSMRSLDTQSQSFILSSSL